MEIDGGVDALPAHLMNKVNQELTAQIAYYENEVENVQREVDDHKDRLKFMQDHLHNVKAEIINTQALYEAKRREVESEDHICQLAERERGRLVQKLQQLNISQNEIQEKIDAVQNRIFQGNVRMDEFKAAMNFNQEELEQWDLARKQKEDDAVVLEKYSKADDAKMKDLNLQIEKLSKQVQKKKLELEQEVTETRSSQIELDKTSEDYKALHKERQHLLDQWEETVKAMHRRDNAIKASEDRYAEGKQWLEKRHKQLKARAEFHQVELNNNKELEAKIAQEERVLSKYRDDQTILSKHLGDLEDEKEVLRNTLLKAQHDKQVLNATKEVKQMELVDKQNHYTKMQGQHEQIIAKFQEELEAASDLERQSKIVDDLLMDTEQSMKALDKEMTRIKEEQYQNSQQLFNVRRQQANYLAEISGAQAQGRNMNAKITQLDAESFKQQELLYSIEFNIQQMERKVNRAKGERTEEEKRELQEKIEMLQKMLDDLVKQHKVLETQVKRVTDDLRQTQYDAVKLESEKKRVTEELLELTLENESCGIELQRMMRAKEDELVNADVLKLQVERLKMTLQVRDHELLGLENRKDQLELTVAERESEIKVHQDVLRMEIKTTNQERKQIMAELRERQLQVAHLQHKYEVLLGRMDKEQGEMTHAQHIVKTAKEREELQAQGDTLDAQIKKAERETRKLDKTIASLKGANTKFKHQFTKVNEGDDELVQQKLLSQKTKDVQTIINRRTNEMKEFLRTEMSKMNELQDRQRELGEMHQKGAVLDEGRTALVKDIDEQREAVARYDVAISKVKKTTEKEIVDDILLLEEAEKQEAVVMMLLQAAEKHGPETSEVVKGTLLRNNVPLPAGVEGDEDEFPAPPPEAGVAPL